jgi:hypothetical protein
MWPETLRNRSMMRVAQPMGLVPTLRKVRVVPQEVITPLASAVMSPVPDVAASIAGSHTTGSGRR